MKPIDESNYIVKSHVCADCGEVNKGYFELLDGGKRCKACGGLALFLQEAADKILELKETVRALEEINAEIYH